MVKIRHVKYGVKNWLGFKFISPHGGTVIKSIADFMILPEKFEEESEEVDWPHTREPLPKPMEDFTFF